MNEKIELVKAHRHRYGLNTCLRAVGLSKGTWHYRQRRRPRAERDAALKTEIVSVIESHPGYGFRRIQAELVARMARPINHKRLRRVLTRYDLGLRRCLPAASSSPVVKVVAQRRPIWSRGARSTRWRSSRPILLSCSTLVYSARRT